MSRASREAANRKRKSGAQEAAAAAGPSPLRWLPWAAGLAAAAAAVIVYARTLHGPFVFDDIYLPMFQPPRSMKVWLMGVRPMLMLSYWLNFQISDLDPFPYHLWNLLLHLANSWLVYLIVRRLLDWSRRGEEGTEWKRQMLSLFAGAVFLLHPLQTESVAYIAGRSETLSVFFAWAAYALFLYRRDLRVTAGVAAAVVALFGLAVMSKEHAVALAALLLLTDYYWNPGFNFDGMKRNWKLYAPLAVAAAIGSVLIFRVLAKATTAGFHMDQITPARYFFTQCRAIWTYVRMFVVPVGQNVDHRFALSYSVLDHGAIFGLAALVALVVAAWIWRKRFPLASFGAFTFLVLLAPTSSFVPIRDLLVERRVYLPMLGLLLVMVDVLARWRIRERVLGLTLCGVAVALAAMTSERAAVWTSDVALWEDAAAKDAGNSRAQFQLGFAYFQANRCGESAAAYERASKLTRQPEARLWVDWALALDCAGRQAEALAMLDREKARYRDGHLYATLGMIAGKQGMAERALAALAAAEALDSGNEMVYFYRGNVYMTEGRYREAVAAYQKMLAIKPDVPGGRAALAAAVRQLSGGR